MKTLLKSGWTYAAILLAVVIAMALCWPRAARPTTPIIGVDSTVAFKHSDSVATELVYQLKKAWQKDSALTAENAALNATNNYWKNRQRETENNLYAILHLPNRSIPANLDRYFTDYLNRYYGEPDSSSALLPISPTNTNR